MAYVNPDRIDANPQLIVRGNFSNLLRRKNYSYSYILFVYSNLSIIFTDYNSWLVMEKPE